MCGTWIFSGSCKEDAADDYHLYGLFNYSKSIINKLININKLCFSEALLVWGTKLILYYTEYFLIICFNSYLFTAKVELWIFFCENDEILNNSVAFHVLQYVLGIYKHNIDLSSNMFNETQETQCDIRTFVVWAILLN